MPQAEITRLEKERGAAVPYNSIFPNADARANLRANLSTQLGSKADFNISSGYLARANRQPQNEDNSVGLMVDALGGLARTDLQGLARHPAERLSQLSDGRRLLPGTHGEHESLHAGVQRAVLSVRLAQHPRQPRLRLHAARDART